MFFTLGKAIDQREDGWLGTEDGSSGRSPADCGTAQPEPGGLAAPPFPVRRHFALALAFRRRLYLAIPVRNGGITVSVWKKREI